MILLLSQRHSRDRHHQRVDSLESAYVTYFEQFGATVVPVSNVSRLPDRLPPSWEFAGIVLTGGGNVNPSPHGGDGDADEDVAIDRERTERTLVELALRRRKPVLGICRGMQFLNVFFGGAVSRLDALCAGGAHPPASPHEIRIEEEALREKARGDRFRVNSYHDWGIAQTQMARELRCFATATDEPIVEGLYHETHPIAGLQWHPERVGAPEHLDRVLIQAFLERELYWA